MKYRLAFVSNSSASSFVCPVCGDGATGWDGDYGGDTISCNTCGETFCGPECFGGTEEIKRCSVCREVCDEPHCGVEDGSPCPDGRSYSDLDIPNLECPVCSMEVLKDEDLATYLLLRYQVPRADVFAEVKKLNKRRRVLYDHEYIGYVCGKFGLNPIDLHKKLKEDFKDLHTLRLYYRDALKK